MDEKIKTLKEWVDGSENIVFFGGAGVSTESGIKDFRSVDGLYHQKFKYPPEYMLSHSFYVQHTEEFFDFYRNASDLHFRLANTPVLQAPMISSKISRSICSLAHFCLTLSKSTICSRLTSAFSSSFIWKVNFLVSLPRITSILGSSAKLASSPVGLLLRN